MAALPKRKAKPMLTLIPEAENAINYRFNVALCGEQAKEVAHLAVESEMAEAYRPKGGAAHKKVEVKPISEEDEEEHAAATTPSAHEHHGHHDDDHEEQLVVFCPTGVGTKELARLRLTPVVGFSDSLPLTKDKAVAVNLVVCFLVWKPNQTSTIADAISDFQGRMAEIIHTPAGCRPLVMLLAFEADDAQEKELSAFVERQKAVTITPLYLPDDGEDTVMDSLQSVCEAMVIKQTNPRRLSECSDKGVTVASPQDGKKSRGCTIS